MLQAVEPGKDAIVEALLTPRASQVSIAEGKVERARRKEGIRGARTFPKTQPGVLLTWHRASARESVQLTTRHLHCTPVGSQSTLNKRSISPLIDIEALDAEDDTCIDSAFSTTELRKFPALPSHVIPNRILGWISRRASITTSHPECSCASCGTRITPYWRDSWCTELMLCNACGLRYLKTAQRCRGCGRVPRRDNLGNAVCKEKPVNSHLIALEKSCGECRYF